MKIEIANLDRQGMHDLLATSLAPLPVVLISTIGEDGIYNAAPFSFFAPVSSKPPIICFSAGVYGKAYGTRQGQKKDTVKNIEFSRDFVVNIVDEDIVRQAVQASVGYPPETDEIREVGLTPISGEKVKSPRIAESKVGLECRLIHIVQLMDEQALRSVIFGEAILAHIKDEVWIEDKLEPSRLKLVGRMAKDLYCRTGDMFEVKVS